MSRDRRVRRGALLLLVPFRSSTTVPQAFAVCVSEGDPVSLEAACAADPCETKFIFGAHSGAARSAATCTDIPAIQLAALSLDSGSRSRNLPCLRPISERIRRPSVIGRMAAASRLRD